MVRRLYLFERPERFVVGTVGEPGNRTFFLQAREGGRVVSVVLEKVQVAVLADRIGRILDELAQEDPAAPPDGPPPPDLDPLDEPLMEAFRAGTLTLGWDPAAEEVLIEAREQMELEVDAEPSDEEEVELPLEVDDEDEDGPDILRVRISTEAARSFVERAARVVSSGRPPCPLCGQPLDPLGHLCPRRNGHYVN
jgi:uncharacterized repeat protein (TIGR03847 family)